MGGMKEDYGTIVIDVEEQIREWRDMQKEFYAYRERMEAQLEKYKSRIAELERTIKNMTALRG